MGKVSLSVWFSNIWLVCTHTGHDEGITELEIMGRNAINVTTVSVKQLPKEISIQPEDENATSSQFQHQIEN